MTRSNWKTIYTFGAIAALIVVLGSVFDIIIGTALGGSVEALPKTAIDRFSQFRSHPWVGLYNLDLLNMVTMVIMFPAFFALYGAHRKTNNGLAGLALAFFLIGAAVFVANNTALPMLELSKKYYSSESSYQKGLIAAAGEAMLARGAHGSPGAFAGFALVLLSEIVMAFAMLKSGVFGKITAWTGITGCMLMLVYIILVTFMPGVKAVAMLVSIPGGSLLMAWMILFAARLLRFNE